MRNAYISINYGDFVDGSTNKKADPYIQLLPLTDDLAEAHSDFVNVRLMGDDQTGNFHLLPASVLPPDNSTNSDGDDDDQSFSDKIHPYIPYLIAGSVGGAVLLLIAIAFCVVSSRRSRYRRLHDPAPQGLPVDHHQDAPFMRYEPTNRY